MLLSCPECKGQVSSRATACPHCGHPLIPEKRQETPRERLLRKAKRLKDKLRAESSTSTMPTCPRCGRQSVRKAGATSGEVVKGALLGAAFGEELGLASLSPTQYRWKCTRCGQIFMA